MAIPPAALAGMTDGPSSSTNETSSPAAQPVENITTLGYAVATVEEGSFVVLVVLSVAFCLVAAFFCFNVWYNHVHGYSIPSATMRRFRKNKSALITAVVEEEDSTRATTTATSTTSSSRTTRRATRR